jgi:hypothetical protein
MMYEVLYYGRNERGPILFLEELTIEADTMNDAIGKAKQYYLMMDPMMVTMFLIQKQDSDEPAELCFLI